MPRKRKQELRVVVASPGDVEKERDVVQRVIKRVNQDLKNLGRNLTLKPSTWEEDVYPAADPGGAQAHVESILRIKECDILLGILWRRLGAGTEHEIRLAYEAWQAGGTPQVMLYFSQSCYTLKSKGGGRRLWEGPRVQEGIRSKGVPEGLQRCS